MRSFLVLSAALLASAAAAAPQTYVAPIGPARDLPPVGQVTAIVDRDADTIRFLVTAAPGSLDQGAHQLHLHANYAGDVQIGDTLPTLVEAIDPATTDDRDGDGQVELFEAVPLIGESWWTFAVVNAAPDGSLDFDSGVLSTAADQLQAPDEITIGSPGVSGPEDLDFPPPDIDNIGFFSDALDQFSLLAFDIHGKFDPAGLPVSAAPGEIDGDGSYEPNGPALGGAFGAAQQVPAPGALALFGLSIAGLGILRRR